MAEMWGADVAQLHDLDRQLRGCADRLDALSASLGRDVTALVWRGPDADSFRQQWGSQGAPALTDAREHLRQAASFIGEQADLQQRVSRGDPT